MSLHLLPEDINFNLKFNNQSKHKLKKIKIHWEFNKASFPRKTSRLILGYCIHKLRSNYFKGLFTNKVTVISEMSKVSEKKIIFVY